MRLVLISSGSKELFPDVAIRRITPHERMALVGRRAGLFLGLALVSVFFPVVHFVLVPLFLFLTLYMGLKARKAQVFIPAFKSPCPNCGQEVFYEQLEIETDLRRPCPQCRDQLKLTFQE